MKRRKKNLERKVVSFTLPESYIKIIKEIAKKEGKSQSIVAEELIKAGLENRKKAQLENKSISPERLKILKGAVSLGGDALKDSETIYE